MMLGEYYDMLDNFDWYYPFSDMPGYFSKMEIEFKRVQDFGTQSKRHARLFRRFLRFKNREENAKTGRPYKKPIRPRYGTHDPCPF